MGELWKLIVVEGLYQFMAAVNLRQRVMLTRHDFCAMPHTVVMNVDSLLECLRLGIIPIPEFHAGKPSIVLPPNSRN